MRRNTAFLLPAIAIAAITISLFVSAGTGLSQTIQNERMSVTPAGAEAHGPSTQPAVSADGRYVAFASDAPDLVPGDTATRDVYLHDRVTGATERVSISAAGVAGDAPSMFPSISGDGRYVVFQSEAGNLAADNNSGSDIFLRDRQAGTTTLVSVASNSDQGNASSTTPSISADGRYVTFTSLADNLVANDDNSDGDVFLRDLTSETTELVSQATDGTHGNFNSGGLGAGPARVSADGHFVVFGSFANNLVAGDGNGVDDIFVRDRVAHTTERVSVATNGSEGHDHSMYGSISDDGNHAVFFSEADDLVANDGNTFADVFLRDRTMSTTTRISVGPGGVEGNGASRFPVISSDGIIAGFESEAQNLVGDDMNSLPDIFLYHIDAGWMERATIGIAEESNGPSSGASLSEDGTVVGFQSHAWDLVLGDGNNETDVFARGKSLVTPTPTPQTPTATPTPTPQECLPSAGDANKDGTVNSIDAALVLQFSAGLISSISSNSDANGDGETNSIDAALILQYTAGFINCLPP